MNKGFKRDTFTEQGTADSVLVSSRSKAHSILAWHALVLTLGFSVLALVMYRPVPHQIRQWNSPESVWALLSNAVPDSVMAARFLLAAPLLLLVVVHLHLLARVRRYPSDHRWLAPILIGAGAMSVVPALARHTFSGDVAAYILYGRVAAIHGANPMTVPPDAFPEDPFLPLHPWNYSDTVSVYGPVWNLLSDGLTRLAEALGGDYETYVLLYRVVCMAGFLVSVASVWALAGLWAPEHRLLATLLYAWAPLTLIEVSAVHNDFVMLGLVGLGFVLAERRRAGWAVAVMTLAVLVKWIAVVPLLLLMVSLIASISGGRQRASMVARLVGVGAAVTVPAYLAYGSPVASALAPFSEAGSGVINSLSEFGAIVVPRIVGIVGITLDWSEVSPVLQQLATGVAAAILVLGVVLAWRRSTIRSAAAISVGTLLVITLVAPRFWPWYAVWSLMLAAFASAAVRRAAIVLSVTALFVYVLYPVPEGHTPLTAARSLLITLPVAVTWITTTLVDRRAIGVFAKREMASQRRLDSLS